MSKPGATARRDEVRAGRPEAAAAIWDWRTERDDRAERTQKARIGGAVRALFAGVVGGAFTYFGRPLLASLVFGIGSITLALALFSPLGSYAALERWIVRLSKIVGRGLSWLVYPVVFFGFMAPFGLLFRRGKNDPLTRATHDASYWVKRDKARALDKPY